VKKRERSRGPKVRPGSACPSLNSTPGREARFVGEKNPRKKQPRFLGLFMFHAQTNEGGGRYHPFSGKGEACNNTTEERPPLAEKEFRARGRNEKGEISPKIAQKKSSFARKGTRRSTSNRILAHHERRKKEAMAKERQGRCVRPLGSRNKKVPF